MKCSHDACTRHVNEKGIFCGKCFERPTDLCASCHLKPEPYNVYNATEKAIKAREDYQKTVWLFVTIFLLFALITVGYLIWHYGTALQSDPCRACAEMIPNVKYCLTP